MEFLLVNANPDTATENEQGWIDSLAKYKHDFIAAMNDDINTADAIAVIFELVRDLNSNLDAASSKPAIIAGQNLFAELTGVLGLAVKEKESNLDEEIEALIQQRQAARKAKDFKRADEIRDELLAKGIVLEDTREGVKWKKA
jgi:cysteinyl-tRNA synthetase